jgi:hypothetical protein
VVIGKTGETAGTPAMVQAKVMGGVPPAGIPGGMSRVDWLMQIVTGGIEGMDKAAGCVSVRTVSARQPFDSVTVTVKVPAGSEVAEEVVCTGVELQEYVYGATPVETVTEVDPLLTPWQVGSMELAEMTGLGRNVSVVSMV